MRLEAIAIGTELLTTDRLDTNSVWMSQRLADLGLAFHRKTAVGDDREDLRHLFREALDRSDWIICTGGLGPTFDDFTKEVWAEVLGVDMHEDAQARKDLEAFFASRQRVPSPSNYQQVQIPVGSLALPNAFGTAPGVLWTDLPGFPGRTVVMLPGVPREMKGLWEAQIAPRLAALAGGAVHTLRLLTCGIPESTLEDQSRELRQKHAHLDWTILSSQSQVELQARSGDPGALAACEADFRTLLGQDLVCVGWDTIESTVQGLLETRGETFAVAESMTGGALAARYTALPGASTTFLGGAIVYSPRAKEVLAEVPAACLQAEGTVSEATTRALAEGIRTRLGATWGVAITGNAGPTEDPGGPAPVGTTWIAIAGPDGTSIFHYRFPGARPDVQTRAAAWGLDQLRRRLQQA